MLLYDGLAVTNPDRYRREALATLCDVFHRTAHALRAGDRMETADELSLLRSTLRRISEITESIAEQPVGEPPAIIRLFFEDDTRGLKPGCRVIFMGLDRMAHQVDRSRKAAEFRSLGLEVGASYEIARLPHRDSLQSFEIVAPGGQIVAICPSYFGRIL